ncbi:hypothetical protein [Natronococcus sp.]|uniref:DUF7344 domain-containing protein n=1 Tax=Natronococcus sp. TaxID=35747 RepID=UPI003A4DF3ED
MNEEFFWRDDQRTREVIRLMTQITQSISTENALEIVANSERRSVLTRLRDSENNVVTLNKLVDHITSENPPPEPAGVGRSEQIVLKLEHTHLPKLADIGLIEYDDRTDTVRYHPDERVEKLHQFVTTELE